jgi:hypothetical protein
MPLENLFSDDLKNADWLGKVIDNKDPDFEGKIKVKVFGKFDDMPDADIPWARPLNRTTGGSASGSGFHSVPKVDSIVGVKFDNGDIHEPEYFYMQHISDELKSEIQGSYDNAHSLIYDTITDGAVKIFFTEQKGIMLDYKQSQINIKPDKSIIIQTASRNSIIEILDDGTMNVTQSNNINITCKADTNLTVTGNINVKSDAAINVTSAAKTTLKCSNLIVNHASTVELGAGATDHVVLGEKLKQYFDTHIHPTPAGPTGPPIIPMPASVWSAKQVKSL